MKTACVSLFFVAAVAATLSAADPPKKATGSKKDGNLDINIATISRVKDTARDGSGRIDRVTDVSPVGTITTRDANGQIIVSSSENKDTGTTTHRDNRGRILGTTHKMPSGNEVTRNDQGVITTTASTTRAGDSETTTYRDGSGRIIGTRYLSPAGNVTYRDGDGRITGPDFR